MVRATPADHAPGEEDTDDDLLDRLSGLWPTVIPRPTKTQLLALVLITLLSLGPVLALFTIINADVEPVVTLTDEGSAPTGGENSLRTHFGTMRVVLHVFPMDIGATHTGTHIGREAHV